MTDAWITVTVAKKQIEALDVVSLELVSATGKELPAFSAGAHIDVEIEPGLIRQYSLCNPPDQRGRYQVAILRDPASRGGSVKVHERIVEQQTLRVSAPRNHFELTHGTKRAVLIAGGIGVTPLLSMAESLAQNGQDFEMHYCARTRDRCAFYQRLQDAPYQKQVSLYFKDCPDQPRFDLRAILGSNPPDTHVYVCGPQGFIDDVLATANELGFPPEQLHREFFNAQAKDTSGIPQQSFEIALARTGKALQVPADKSIAQTLQDAGIDIELSCEQGVCGACLTGLLEGEAEHRDYFQTAAEQAANTHIALCCSRAKSGRLVLDL